MNRRDQLLLGSIWNIKKVQACCPNEFFSIITEDSDTIDFSGSGTVSDPLTADVIISSEDNNLIVALPDGIYAGAPDLSFFARNGTNLDSGWVEFGGLILHDTIIDQDANDINFTNGKVGFNMSTAPSHTISIGNEYDGAEVLWLYGNDGSIGVIEKSGSIGSLAIRGKSGVQIIPDWGSGGGFINIDKSTGQHVSMQLYSGGNNVIGHIGLDTLVPGVSNEFYIKALDTGIDAELRVGYLTLYDKIKLIDIPQNDTALRVVALDDSDNVRFIASSVLGGGSATSINVATFSGDGVATTFTIAHGITGTPKFQLTAASSAAAGITYGTVDTTNITVYYSVAPISGSSNVLINWSANL